MVAGTLRRLPPIAWQALRFGIVGSANALSTFAVIWLLRTHFGAAIWLASATGYIIGMMQGFVLSRFWTFAGTNHEAPVAAQIIGFVIVNFICGSLFTFANTFLSTWLPLSIASITSAIVVMPLGFVLNRWWVFREARR